MRWQSPDGTIWASRFEYEVFLALGEQLDASGRTVTPTCRGGDHTFVYTDKVAGAACEHCGSTDIGKARSYTPDFFVHRKAGVLADGGGYYIEAKGFIRSERRRLLRAFRRARPDIDLRLLLQRDYKVTSSLTMLQWCEKYLKCPAEVWRGKLPAKW